MIHWLDQWHRLVLSVVEGLCIRFQCNTFCTGKSAGATKAAARWFFLPIVLTATLTGCGYHVAGHSDSVPKTIHVIAVPAMENKTTSYRIEQKLTAATIHELLTKTHYKIVSDADGGDAVLTGKVVSLDIVPLLYNTTTASSGAQTAQATAMLITMRCDVTFTDRLSQKVLYHNDSFVFRNEYELSSDVKSFFQEGDPAVDRMAKDFASRLVTVVTENY